MSDISFDKILLKTAFCCMASDGHIDSREVIVIKSLLKNIPLFQAINFEEEINFLVSQINSQGREFIELYFDLLNKTSLTEEEELTLIDFAIQTIKADEQIEYSEVKFFKNIRHRLKVSNETILNAFPDIEFFLETDLSSESNLDKITTQYLESAEFPKFTSIHIDDFNATDLDSPDV